MAAKWRIQCRDDRGRIKPHYSDEFKKQVVNSYLAGASSYELKDKLHVSATSVRLWVKALGKSFLRGRVYPRKDYSFLDNINPLDLAYVAGILDGEGCISTGNCGTYFSTTVSIVNTHKETMLWLASLLKAKISQNPPRKENHQIRYVISLSRFHAEALLKRLTPFLKIKQKQARLVLSVQNLARRNKSILAVRNQIKALNRGENI